MAPNAFNYLALGEQLALVHTERLALRAVALSDAWPLHNATQNPGFNSHLLWGRPADEQSVIDRIDGIMAAARHGKIAAVSAVLKSTGEWVSLYRFLPHGLDTGVVEMGLWVHPRFWRGGFGAELSTACVNAAFEVSNVGSLLGAASPDNAGSCRVLELCGLKPTGRVEMRATESGRVVPLQHFQLTRLAWQVARGPSTRLRSQPRAAMASTALAKAKAGV